MNTGVKSIRSEMMNRILAGTAALLVLCSALLGILFNQRLAEEFDEALEARADALMSSMALDKDVLDFDFNEDVMTEFALPEEDDEEEGRDDEEVAFFELLLPGGEALSRSPSLGNRTLSRAGAPPARVDEPVFWNDILPNGQPGRILLIDFAPEVEDEEGEPDEPEEDEDHIALPDHLDPGDLRLLLVVARSRGELRETLLIMYGSLAGFVLVVLAGIWLVLRRALRKGFQPVDQLNEQLREIGPGSLTDRVSLMAPREELATIEGSVNQLLERVAAGFERERRFSSNVAHELRTPVSELRSACEVGSRWPEDPEVNRALFEDIRGVGMHMEKIVETLLTLARCESGSIPVERKVLALEPCLEGCWERVAAEAGEREITMELEVATGLTVTSDPDKLEMILQNLVENAVVHSVPATRIRCAGYRENGTVEISLINRPADLGGGDLSHLFERCWQKNPADTEERNTGLGLSIAKALTDRLGIGIETILREEEFEVRLSFPEDPLEARPVPLKG